METKEELLKRYGKLKDQARKAAVALGHDLEPFGRIRAIGYTNCRKCGCWTKVNLFPKGGAVMEGTSLTKRCKE